MLADRRQAHAGVEGAVSQFAADPKRRRCVKSHARGHSRGRACLGSRRGTQIRDACRKVDVARGEKLLAGVGGSPLDAFNALQPAIQDDLNVHRFVFAHRTYGLVGLLGEEYSYSMLRECVRLCRRSRTRTHQAQSCRVSHSALVPELLDQYKLDGKKTGKRDPGDAAVNDLCLAIYNGPPQRGRSRGGGSRRGNRPRSDRRGDLTGIKPVRPAAGDGQLAAMAIRRVSIRPTPPTPGATWCGLPSRDTPSPG